MVLSLGPEVAPSNNPLLHYYVALSRKSYADEGGSIDEKFEKLESVFSKRDRELCPGVCGFFDDYYTRHVSTVGRMRTVLWHDVAGRQAKLLQKRAKARFRGSRRQRP